MKKHFLNFLFIVVGLVLTVSLFSCDTGEVNSSTVASDSSANSVTKRDTAMPHEPVKAVVAATDSVTPNAQNSTKDPIGSKISVHKGKVKVVDTTKND